MQPVWQLESRSTRETLLPLFPAEAGQKALTGTLSVQNCPSQWRVYDTSGPKPPKRKVVLACANCGSGKDHFIDDW